MNKNRQRLNSMDYDTDDSQMDGYSQMSAMRNNAQKKISAGGKRKLTNQNTQNLARTQKKQQNSEMNEQANDEDEQISNTQTKQKPLRTLSRSSNVNLRQSSEQSPTDSATNNQETTTMLKAKGPKPTMFGDDYQWKFDGTLSVNENLNLTESNLFLLQVSPRTTKRKWMKSTHNKSRRRLT
jgi:hypothetical protein